MSIGRNCFNTEGYPACRLEALETEIERVSRERDANAAEVDRLSRQAVALRNRVEAAEVRAAQWEDAAIGSWKEVVYLRERAEKSEAERDAYQNTHAPERAQDAPRGD